jgi:hypothetical protein
MRGLDCFLHGCEAVYVGHSKSLGFVYECEKCGTRHSTTSRSKPAEKECRKDTGYDKEFGGFL